MSQELRASRIETPMGALTLRAPPEPPDAAGPVLVVAAGLMTPIAVAERLPQHLAGECHVALAELPLDGADAMIEPNLIRVADVLGAAVHAAFAGRPVMLLGLADAGIVAARARAPELLRILAVEPPVRSAGLGARAAEIDARAAAGGPDLKPYVLDLFGRGEGGGPRDHRPAFRGLASPVDVIVSDAASGSVVDAETRASLAATPSVEVRIAPGPAEAVDFLLGVVRARLRQLPDMALAPEAVARRLAGAVPRTARRIAYVGPQVEAFRAACLRIHPQAAVTEAQAGAEACDAVVLHHPAPEDVSRGVIERLADGGLLLATAPLGERARALRETVGRLGLTLLPGDRIITPSATALLRARKGPAPATVRLDFVAFARMLMDIRTHLPTDALRSQPELKVSYLVPPFRIDPGDPQPGRLLILQRPGRNPPERIWDLAARAILADTVVVIEFDDHPELVSQIIRGKDLVDEDWEAYRAVHGIQTTNDLLLEVFGRCNPEVRAFQNAVFDLPPFPAGPRPQRVFYGGVTRGPFVAEVAAALKPAIEAFPDADFIVLGDRAFFDALPTDKKQYADYVGYDRYLELMARCTVNLSPLAYRPMMETKSDAKYLDSARCGSLMIASPTVYERAIRHGENGFIARELADWPKLLAQALGDEAGRERMARAAYEEVRASRMFAHQVPDRLAWYSSLLERREALNRAILERRPQVAQRLAQLRKHFGR